MTKQSYNIRNIALDLLMRISDQGGYSHLVIDQMLKKHQLEPRDSGLLTEIVYGTLQRKLTLEYDLNTFIKSKKKIDKWVKWLLYLSFYQMKYLDKVPDHAVIHESVEIAKRKGHKGIANFVNGILRSAQREGFPDYQDINDQVKRVSIETSHPLWLVKRWNEQYGIEITEQMCQTNITHKKVSIRVQPLRMTREQLLSRLENSHIKASLSSFSEQGLVIEEGNILKDETFQESLFTIQDESSMLVAELMDLQEGMTVLDACSAPGGKATHIAEKMNDNGTVFAYDLHEKKAKLVKKKAEELGLTSIQSAQSDARKLQETHAKQLFDRILIDAPCSGLGVLRSKPDIKYNKTKEDIVKLSTIQKEILHHIEPLLKNEGKLMYSTCTVDQEENEEVIKDFLEKHQTYRVDPAFFDELPEELKNSSGRSKFGIQIFPQDINSDGFFMTRLVKDS
ncbi:16S rRNA (cytosine(967)-C(5))-methyltransferase RsmB [Gracilibacillus salitolerans]|uniref:16S rRNA (cytosine(967)-C(5))-methyltransferase n=1 Tax=Gracilibacillus salitolerans TaxID=2663022 RepID=A0A5Q2THZ7_9BACI|nr:16S rRNA (cytosine(967)-C(5))-methyltransferase RsmB [Gracilibacillus salitolerans]QGH34489.1 16S rRNA (cytosine(967)-C(5))-methyltransferase RsmB [Gracilibacillus salitolerans]